MLGYSSINQTLQSMVVQEKIRNFLVRYSLANNQIFNYFALQSIDSPEIDSYFAGFLFNAFFDELKTATPGRDLSHEYAIAAIFVEDPTFNFQIIDSATAFKKGKDALFVQFGKSLKEFSQAFIKKFNPNPKKFLPQKLIDFDYAPDSTVMFFNSLVSEGYFRMISTTYPSSYPLYSAVGPLWNLRSTGGIQSKGKTTRPEPTPKSYPAAGAKSLKGDTFASEARAAEHDHRRYLYNGPLAVVKKTTDDLTAATSLMDVSPLAIDISLKNNKKLNGEENNYSLFRGLDEVAPLTFYLEVFFRLKDEAMDKIKISPPGNINIGIEVPSGTSFIGEKFASSNGAFIWNNGNQGWVQLRERIEALEDDYTANTELAKEAFYTSGMPYLSKEGFLNDIRLASQYLSYDEVFQLIELSKGPRLDGAPNSGKGKGAKIIELTDFDIGVRLMFNATKDFFPTVKWKYDEGKAEYDLSAIDLPYIGAKKDKTNYAIQDDVMRRLGAKLREAIEGENNKIATKSSSRRFSSGAGVDPQTKLQHSPMLLARSNPPKDGTGWDLLDKLNKLIYNNINVQPGITLSTKSFMQVEYSKGVPPSAVQNWAPKKAAVLLSLPIAEFLLSDLTKILLPAEAATFSTLTTMEFLADPDNNIETGTFEREMLPLLLFGLANTENAKFLFDDQIGLPVIMSLTPIYNVLRNEDLNLSKFFLIEGSPLVNHNEMIDEILDKLINFNKSG